MKSLFLYVLIIASLSGYAQICSDEPIHQGEGTWYVVDQTSVVNCSYSLQGVTPLYIGAMNHVEYDSSAACGACAEVLGPDGKVTIRIVDRCPECAVGDIDLSREAFQQIAELDDGRIPISWKYIPCPLASKKIGLSFKDGSSQWWMGVQAIDHVNRIVRIEGKNNGGSFQNLERQNYNYFLAPTGLGPAPLQFRITDVYGEQVVVTSANIESLESTIVATNEQFTPCTITSTPTLNDQKKKESYIVNNILYIEPQATSIRCFDTLGRLLFEEEIIGQQYSLEQLVSGHFYIVQVASRHGIQNIKYYQSGE